MKKQNLQIFHEKYSELIPQKNIIEIENGWNSLIEEMLGIIKVYQDVNLGKSNLLPTVFNSIKSNQGWMDIDYCGGDEVVLEIVNFATISSFKTCEICGEKGKLFCSKKWLHWSNKKTLCTKHAVKLYYYSIT